MWKIKEEAFSDAHILIFNLMIKTLYYIFHLVQNFICSRAESPESVYSLISTLGCGLYIRYFLNFCFKKKVVCNFSLITTTGKLNMAVLESMGIYRVRKQKLAIILPSKINTITIWCNDLPGFSMVFLYKNTTI